MLTCSPCQALQLATLQAPSMVVNRLCLPRSIPSLLSPSGVFSRTLNRPAGTLWLRRCVRLKPSMVAEAEIKEELGKLLKTVDFSTTSERQIRQQLCEKLGEDVLNFKEVIKVPTQMQEQTHMMPFDLASVRSYNLY